MTIDKNKLWRTLSYLTIAAVSLVSILAYSYRAWKFGIVTVGISFILLALFFFSNPDRRGDE